MSWLWIYFCVGLFFTGFIFNDGLCHTIKHISGLRPLNCLRDYFYSFAYVVIMVVIVFVVFGAGWIITMPIVVTNICRSGKVKYYDD